MLRAIFETSLDAILLADDEGKYVDANPAACELLGVSKAELLGRSISDFAKLEVNFAEAWADFLRRGQVRGEFHLIRPDGTERIAEYAATANVIPHRHVSFLRDITLRKQAEAEVQRLNTNLEQRVLERTEALCQSEQRLNSILGTIEDIVWSADITTLATIYINPSAELIYGYSLTDFLNNPTLWFSCIHPEDLPQVTQALQTVLTTGSSAVEYRFIRSDGGIRWLYDRAHLVCDAGGKPLRLDGIATDITERKRIGAERQKTADMFQKLSAQVPGMLYQYQLYPDGRSRFPYASEAIHQIYEVTPQQVQESAEDVFKVLHPDDAARVWESIQSSYQTLELWHDEYRVLLPQRGLRWLEGHAMPERLEDGSILWHGYIWDITERKQLDLVLRSILEDASQTRAKLNDVLNNATAAIMSARVFSDRSVEYEYWSAGCATLFGYTAEELMADQKLWWSHVLPEDIERHVLPSFDLIFKEQPFQFEYQFQHPDGNRRWIAVNVTSRWDQGSQCWIATKVHTDISERVRIENERQAAEEILKLQSEREQLLSSITQHIRQSLQLSDILNTATTEINQLLQADRVLVYRLHDNGSGAIVVESVVPPWTALLGTTIRDPCFKGNLVEQYRHGRVCVIEDIHTTDMAQCHLELLSTFQIQANLVVPINCEGNLWGLLCVHQCRSTRQWQQWEVELLQQLSAQLTIAIQQAQLYEEVQNANTNLEKKVAIRTKELRQSLDFEALLKRITDKVRDSLEESQILQSVVEELALGLNVECCDTGIYNKEQTVSTIAYEYTRSLTPAQGATIIIAEAICPAIYETLFRGEICQFCIVSPYALRQNGEPYSVLACPIIDNQGLLGDLWLFKPYNHVFSPVEIRLVQQVANQCAIGLRQSRLYQTAQAQVAELERLNHLKDDFLSTVSHELRSPMSNIKMATQMLEITLKQLGVLSTENNLVARYFQILQEEGQREISLINDLLDLARLDADVEPLTLSSISLQNWIPHIAEPFLNRIQNQQQRLQLNIPPELPPIKTDLSYLERVLTELLHNACKYTPPEEQIIVSVNLDQTTIPHHFCITVTNTGIEISPIEYERVFEKFYRIPNRDPWKHGGTGLGLALAKKLIEKLDGSITASSCPRQTTFTLRVPRQLQDCL